MFHPIFMGFNPISCYVSPKIVILQEPLIVETRNKCHWIWHTLNPKCAPLKKFQCIFCSQNQQNVKFLPEIVISGTTYHRDLKPAALDSACLKLQICTTQAILMHFSQSKWTKCEICAVSWTPPDKKLKKMSIGTGKKCSKRLANLHT